MNNIQVRFILEEESFGTDLVDRNAQVETCIAMIYQNPDTKALVEKYQSEHTNHENTEEL